MTAGASARLSIAAFTSRLEVGRWRLRAWIPFLFAAWALAVAVPAGAQDSLASEPTGLRPIPAAAGYVNDEAGVIDEPTRAKLEAFLDQVQKKTGAEFALLTVPSTAPESPSDYKVRVFESWKLGKKGEDNGVLMLVALEEREVRFETGYGLEGTLPDGLQSRLFREVMRPRFRQNDYAGGITAGVLAIAQRIAREKGVTLEWDGRELRYTERRAPRTIGRLIVLLVVIFMIVLIVVSASGGFGGGGSMRRRGRHGGWVMGPGWGGGGLGGGLGGWGGGFGGGGGSFGGGGGFGGFGGGSSGGGGGGGSW